MSLRFFVNAPPPTEIYTLSLHDALPISAGGVLERFPELRVAFLEGNCGWLPWWLHRLDDQWKDRKSTRLNSSHANISYAVFCLKKKNKRRTLPRRPTPAKAYTRHRILIS